jgi:hypothetical protein
MPRFSDRSLRFALAALIIGALVLCIGSLTWHAIPDTSRELVATLTGVLGILARDATRWAFPQRPDHPEGAQ